MPSPHGGEDRRVTLPPIRDLFRDELAQHPNSRHGQESPPSIMARLRVSDTSDERFTHPETPSRFYNSPASSSSYDSRPSSAHSHTRRSSQDRQSEWNSYPGSLSRSSHSYDGLHRADYDQAHLQRSISYQHPPPHTRGAPYDDGRVPSGLPAPRERHEGHYARPPTYPPSRSHTVGVLRPSPWPISTAGVDRSYEYDDDDRTPVARYPPPPHIPAYMEEPIPAAKYECQYCGKGFNRPSSLKIHLNSHTGEKPFACPIDGCGRSFSVLSNMRRHARVHTQPAEKEQGSTDNSSSHPAAGQSSSLPNSSSHGSSPIKEPKWHQRRGSIASTSSSASRRSRSESSEDEEEEERVEKRSRQ